MPEPTNRRGLLRALLQTAGEALGEYNDALNAGVAPFEEKASEQARADAEAEAARAAAEAPELTQMAPVARSLTMDELLDLAAEEGLADRREALRGLARPSTLLIPTIAVDRPWIGRPAAMARADGITAPVAGIDLADGALAGGPLSGDGRLLVMIVVPSGTPIPACSRAHVAVELDPEARREHGASVYLSTGLALPRVWAAAVQALELDEAEQAAYVRLRERVAELQGVPAEEGDAEGVARHHLLGYPTETSGTMPLACELASRGLDPDTPPTDVPEDAPAASERWRLLLQLTQDERSGITLGPGIARLFFWIAEDSLERQDYSEVWAIAR